VDLFLHSYEADIVQELLRKGEKKLAQTFNYTFRYTDAILSLNNKNWWISNFLHLIYPVELVVKDKTGSPNSAFYLDLYLEHDSNGTWQPNFMINVTILTIPFSTVTSRHLLHMVFTCHIQLIRCSRTCNSYQDFIHRSVLLTKKLLSQGFIETRLISTLKSFLVVTIISPEHLISPLFFIEVHVVLSICVSLFHVIVFSFEFWLFLLFDCLVSIYFLHYTPLSCLRDHHG